MTPFAGRPAAAAPLAPIRPWSKAASLGALAALVLGGLALVGGELSAIGQSGADLAARRELLDTLDRASERRLAAGGKAAEPVSEDLFLAGETATIAAAALQARVIAAIERESARLVSVEVKLRGDSTGPAGAGAARLIDVDVGFEAPNEAAQAILFALEHGHPAIVIDHLHMQPARTGGEDPAPDPVLQVALSAHGFWLR